MCRFSLVSTLFGPLWGSLESKQEGGDRLETREMIFITAARTLQTLSREQLHTRYVMPLPHQRCFPRCIAEQTLYSEYVFHAGILSGGRLTLQIAHLGSSRTWLFQTRLFAIFAQKRSFAPFCALMNFLRLRAFALICALLRSFALFCAHLRLSASDRV